MKKVQLIALVFGISLMAFMQSCKKEGSGEGGESGEAKISTHYSTESHNAGRNCITCHSAGGSGEGWFRAAATVYDSTLTFVKPNATLEFYTGKYGTGTLQATLEVDGNGNFYTTSSIDFSNGLYCTVISASGKKRYMRKKITTGECAKCHGVDEDRIWVD
tara:strand:- start:70348 stop:70830 length:483 start_codon:yes stop_codon:yes gene_type:complete